MLCGPIYVPRTLLTLTFPAQMDTLSIDAGFDQSPVLQSIRDHYRDLKCSSDDFVSELSRDSRHVLTRDQRKKLRVVYSTISPSVVSVSSFLVFDGSVAEEIHVRRNDTIAFLNGTPIHSANQCSQMLSEASRNLSDCGDSGERLTVVIHPFDHRCGAITFVADHFSVDDKRFYKCWPSLTAEEWSSKKIGSQENSLLLW